MKSGTFTKMTALYCNFSSLYFTKVFEKVIFNKVKVLPLAVSPKEHEPL